MRMTSNDEVDRRIAGSVACDEFSQMSAMRNDSVTRFEMMEDARELANQVKDASRGRRAG